MVLGDPLYGTRDNRRYLKAKRIRFAGKPLEPSTVKLTPDKNREQLKQLKKQRREEYRQRIPIEGKFGQGKNGYDLGYIRAKTAPTSEAWINSIFLVMSSLMVLLRIFIGLLKLTAKFGQWAQQGGTRMRYVLQPNHRQQALLTFLSGPQ